MNLFKIKFHVAQIRCKIRPKKDKALMQIRAIFKFRQFRKNYKQKIYPKTKTNIKINLFQTHSAGS